MANKTKYGIARLDLVKGHKHHYYIDKEMENGLFAEVDYATGKIVPTTDNKKEQVFVASVTNLYDSLDESDFINTPDGMKVRGIHLDRGDTVTTTQLDFSGDRKAVDAIKKGDFAYAVVGGKTAFSATAPTTDAPAQLFRVVEVTTLNGQPAVAIRA